MWPFSRKPEHRSISIQNPLFLEYFGAAPTNYAGVHVTEATALGISAVWRAVAVIAGTVASLPLKTYRTVGDDERERVPSWLDNPAGPESFTQFEWTEMCLYHILLNGNTYLEHRFNGGGGLIGLSPIHPGAVTPKWNDKVPGGKEFTVVLNDGSSRTFDGSTMTQVMGPTLDGLQGMSVISVARHSLGTAVAGDKGAARMFANGALSSVIVTPEEDITEPEAKQIKESLTHKMTGTDKAGEISVINRRLKLTQWSLSAADAQFLESRQFSVEEVARWFGVPPHLLMQTEKQTSWGTGVSEQNRGLKQFNLLGWTERFEQRLSRLLPRPQFVEFDYAGLERPSAETEIELLIKQVEAGLLTVDEARRKRNLPPLSKVVTEDE